MERVITKHVLGSMYTDDSKPKGVLDLQYYDSDEAGPSSLWPPLPGGARGADGGRRAEQGLRGKVVEHLEKSPRAVIILRDVDRLDKPDHVPPPCRFPLRPPGSTPQARNDPAHALDAARLVPPPPARAC